MRYMNATQAARFLGVNDKTLRIWLKHKKYGLTAIRDASNRLMLAEADVLRVQEARRFLDEAEQDEMAAPEITARLAQLENRIARLERALPARQESATHPSARPPHISATLPPGAIPAKQFAERHGVHPRTFRDHCTAGLAGELAPVTSRQKPNRPNEREYYLTPEQQAECLNYWRRHNVQFQEAPEGE
jgi:DNA-binding transcriptional MerR regulator